MTEKIDRRFNLNGAEIDRCAEEVFRYLTESRIDRKEALRIRLSLEEVLLVWLEKLGAGTEVKVLCSRRFGRQSIRLQCRGVECNPFAEEKGEYGQWVQALRSNLEFLPSYRYADSYNRVMFNVRQKTIGRLAVTVMAIVAGIALGLLGLLLPPALRQSVNEGFFTPVYDTYLAAFSLCGIPLIFTSVVTGILGADDITAFSNNGRRMMGRFALVSTVAAVAALGIALPFFRPAFGAGSMSFRGGALVETILDWVPGGLLEPFIESNAMQLVLLGVGFGVALLLLNRTEGSLVGMLNDLHRLLQKMMGWLSALIPVFVLVKIISSVWTSETAVLLAAWKSWAITIGLQAAMIAVLLVWVAVRYRAGVRELMRKLSKTFFVALGTNSCTTSIPDSYDCCGNALGIDPKVYSFGIPIGTTVFKPATAVRLVVLCLFMATAEGMTVSVWWLGLLVIMAVVLSISVPAIPGGVLILCPMLFTQMGLPTELVTQMLATDVFFDCFCTAFNQVAVPLVLVQHAGKAGLLNEQMISRPVEQLRSPYNYQLEKKLRAESEEYHRIFRDNVRACQKELTRYTSLFPTYTDHSAMHSMQLIDFCNEMVGKNLDRLNADEIFVLLMAAYLHDVGMGVSREELEAFTEELPALAAYRAAHPEEPESELVRRFHNELSGCYIRRHASMLKLPSEGHLHAIIQVARGHRKVDLHDDNEFPRVYPLENGNTVRLAYLAALIRLADELDIAEDRNIGISINPDTLAMRESVLAFRSHHAIRRMDIAEDRFVFTVRRPEDPELQEQLDRTFEKLRETLNDCVDVIETRARLVIRQKFIEVRYEERRR